MSEIALSLNTAPTVGAFGKMPGMGDFFRVNLPGDFVNAWDEWLQSQLVAQRELLGDRWQSCYMSAPIWRFSLRAGLVGTPQMSGVLMASVDRVGRQFPLTLAYPVDQTKHLLLDHQTGNPVFETLEDIAFSALDDDLGRDALMDRLAGVSPPDTASDSFINIGAGAVFVSTDGDAVGALADTLLSQTTNPASIWSAVTPVGAQLLICDALPTPEQMSGLFDLDADIWKGSSED